MCIRKLGIALDGYKHGAVLLFRGTEMEHYVSHWTGEYRYAFDHTTHRSVGEAIEYYKEHGRWGPMKMDKDPKNPKNPKNSSREDDGEEGPDDSSPSDPPRDKPEQPKKRKREHDDEGSDQGPPAKMFPGALPTGRRKKKQTESRSVEQATENSYSLRMRTGKQAIADNDEKDTMIGIAPAKTNKPSQRRKLRPKK